MLIRWIREKGADVPVIVHDEHGRARPSGFGRVRLDQEPFAIADPAVGRGFQEEVDLRAPPEFAFDAERSARLLGDSVDLGEAEAGSLAERLRREERLGRSGEHLGRHALAGVGDRHADIVPVLDLRLT